MWHTMWPDLSLLGKYINTEYNSIGDIRMTDIGGESKLIWNLLKNLISHYNITKKLKVTPFRLVGPILIKNDFGFEKKITT